MVTVGVFGGQLLRGYEHERLNDLYDHIVLAKANEIPLHEVWGVGDWPANFLVDRTSVVRAVNVFEPEAMLKIADSFLISETEADVAHSDVR